MESGSRPFRFTPPHPPDIYLQNVRERAGKTRVTSSPTGERLAYDWRDPEIVRFEASDGVEVPTQLFRPEDPNGATVLFVHGAGYTQNVLRGWTHHFREYMFHNLLADLGYTVVNLDYRGSAGYGRDWRTAIYPVEGHGFEESSSWTDEYRRIVELIRETVGPGR